MAQIAQNPNTTGHKHQILRRRRVAAYIPNNLLLASIVTVASLDEGLGVDLGPAVVRREHSRATGLG